MDASWGDLKIPSWDAKWLTENYPLRGDNRPHPLRHYWLYICISLVEFKAFHIRVSLRQTEHQLLPHVLPCELRAACGCVLLRWGGWVGGRQLCGEVRPPDGDLWNQTRWLSGDSDHQTHTNTLACARISLLLLCCHLVSLLPSSSPSSLFCTLPC